MILNRETVIVAQKSVCLKYGATYTPVDWDLKMGISKNVRSDVQPINGLRHVGEKGTNGWYVYGGEELNQHVDFFDPLHTFHTLEDLPHITKFLALPPGYRFLIALDYEDVWFDSNLLKLH